MGEGNALHIRVYGETGGLEWDQQQPNTLLFKGMNRPAEIHQAGALYLSEHAKRNARLPMGHPEGFIEAFANVYRNFLLSLGARLEGRDPDPEHLDFPTVQDGVRGNGIHCRRGRILAKREEVDPVQGIAGSDPATAERKHA